MVRLHAEQVCDEYISEKVAFAESSVVFALACRYAYTLMLSHFTLITARKYILGCSDATVINYSSLPVLM